jgi:hypothetical protein
MSEAFLEELFSIKARQCEVGIELNFDIPSFIFKPSLCQEINFSYPQATFGRL